MTSHGTTYDQLPMAELHERIIAGEIRALDLPKELLSAWAAWEPPPADLTAFMLASDEHRQEFLYQYCAQGEPAMFTAVAHIWGSLAEPRDARCTLMGIACGAGGKGKMALVAMLDQLLAESLDAIEPLPPREGFDSIEARHQAVMAKFDADEARLRKLCARYSAILDGAATCPDPTGGKLIVGPWPGNTL